MGKWGGVRKNVGKVLKCVYGFYKEISDCEWGDWCAGLLEAERGSRKNAPYWVRKFGCGAGKIAEKGAKNYRRGEATFV